METITVPKTEYQKLIEKALRYEYWARIVKEKENIFASPPTGNIKETIKKFKAPGLYSLAFLKSVEKGLKHSSYFR